MSDDVILYLDGEEIALNSVELNITQEERCLATDSVTQPREIEIIAKTGCEAQE